MSEPDLIRVDSPHQVTLAEGANVAASKKAEATEPSVRKVLADADAPNIEHSLQDQRLAAPDSELSESGAEQPSFDRLLQDNNVLIDAAAEVPHESNGPAIERALTDHFELLPPALPIEAVETEIADFPEALTALGSAPSPVIQHLEDDHFVALPDTLQNASLGSLEFASHEPHETAQPLPETTGTEAPALSAHAAPAVELDIEPTLDTMLPTGLPERLGQLKLENDKVRSKLDVLQALDSKPIHFSQH
jgi:hypothetical protein